jgi:O-antigen/teichoic acid export membrane protein
MQSDRIIISKLIGDMAVLGVYAIAIRLAKVLSTLAGQVVTMVLMPSLAEKRRDIGADAVVSEEMSATYYRTKLMIDAAFLVPAGAFCAMASTVVSILYSAEYSSAGPILQILVFASLFELIASEPGALLTAMGRTQHHFWQALLRAVYTVTMLPFGFYLMGFEGVVWAAAFTNLVGAPFYWIELRSFRLFRPLMELPAVAFFSVGFGMGAVADMLLSRLLA